MFFFRLNIHRVCMILTFFLVSNTEVLTLRVATPLCVCGGVSNDPFTGTAYQISTLQFIK